MGNNFVTTFGNITSAINTKSHDTLDFLSFHYCQEKPTHKLATDNLHIPGEDLTLLMQIFNLARESLGLAIVPFKMLTDKKFSVHIYETSAIFVSPYNPMPQNIISTCEKMLIYINCYKEKIVEPENKRIINHVTIDGHDCALPVNLWYTFNMDTSRKVYFFIYVGTGYKGIVLAVDNTNDKNLSAMKDYAINFYDILNKNKNMTYNPVKVMDFI